MASNIEVASYDPKKVNLVMNGKIITGFASDSMITIARNEDTVTTQVGVKGDVAYNENANESGTITVTLMVLLPACRMSAVLLSSVRKSL